ncbi:MAG: ATP-binding domain-containing protein [Acidobacteria bacterium]|nr:ATP-binding domain-containing protein [Acidobacteriota bacterium]
MAGVCNESQAVLDNGGSAWFNVEWGDRPRCRQAAKAWQILCPVRQKPWGVDTLNKFIHRRYKSGTLDQARMQVYANQRKIPKPMGDDQLVYGDKVMNNRNSSVYKKKIYPEPAETYGYLANGEIGTVVGHRKTKNRNWAPNEMEIEFSTQPGRVFKFNNSDFSDERGASLDLAYALTVHKAQGSEFEIVFLVLPKSPLMLTRELIYTALTRQRKKVIVLHQGSATDLQKLSAEEYSSTKARLTNLFVAPTPIKVGKGSSNATLYISLFAGSCPVEVRGDHSESASRKMFTMVMKRLWRSAASQNIPISLLRMMIRASLTIGSIAECFRIRIQGTVG